MFCSAYISYVCTILQSIKYSIALCLENNVNISILKALYCWKMLTIIWQDRVATILQFLKYSVSVKHNKMRCASNMIWNLPINNLREMRINGCVDLGDLGGEAAPHCYGILVPQVGIEPWPLAIRLWSPNHWTSRIISQWVFRWNKIVVAFIVVEGLLWIYQINNTHLLSTYEHICSKRKS